MISKLPSWIELGAFMLALIAGCINAIGLIGFGQEATSHVTGTATLLATSLIDNSVHGVIRLLGVLAAFFAGALVCGVILPRRALKLGRHYDTALVLEAALILGAFLLLSDGSSYGIFAAAAACGLQNAMATTYSGAIVRTTHLTGIFTDLGLMLGAALGSEPLDKRKVALFLLIVAGFIAGGAFGVFLFSAFAFKALLAPAFICLILALTYHLYRKEQTVLA